MLQSDHVDPHHLLHAANLLRKAASGELILTPWQLRYVQGAIEQLAEHRFADDERKMSETERLDLYEPAGYVPEVPIKRPHLTDRLAAVVAAA